MTLRLRIGHRFPGFQVTASFEAPPSGITGLFGPSGSGKTTVINAIAGLLRPDEGAIELDDRVLLDRATGIDVPARRRRIGYVFQDARLFPHLSVHSNLLYGWRRSPVRLPQHEIDGVIEMLGIAHLLERKPHRLSGGEKGRVSLGRALLSNPDLLLLDEPLAALDTARRHEILPYLERLKAEARVPMVYVSHSIEEITRLADMLVVMNGGRSVVSGPVAEIMSRLDLFPLTGRFEAGAVVDCRVEAHDARHGMTSLLFEGGRFLVPRLAAEPGHALRARIRARDVIVATEEPRGLSANNVLPAIVREIRRDQDPFAEIALDCGGTSLVARITQLSLDRLGLAPGTSVYAIVKALNVETRGSLPAPRRAGGESA
ncbi:molybdenum ABC transporter ATP-binding protein [Lutibaculum baratangense]|uniref:molybdenum ABC transporter ATP-binding protein n=1 Tax=Lutibaculum baratangense TaxID=1358440 RepID=UPI00059012B7|nr:molybdenum ABC transporter ATP-binding protein [Lutibaculum baratangense]